MTGIRTKKVVRLWFWGLVRPLDTTLAACTWVPPGGEGVCEICHAAARPGRRRCLTCVRTTGQVEFPVDNVVPISLYRSGDDLWYLLRRYKDGWDPWARRRLRRRLAWLLCEFLRAHLECIAPGAGDAWQITAVPPTRRRAQSRPVEGIIRTTAWLRRRHVRTLRTVRAPRHNAASDEAFRVVRDVRGRELILVDDTFTTGASVQSAASALQRDGARVLAVVVLGRVVNPEADRYEARLWSAARSAPYRLDRCSREGCQLPRGT